MRKTRVVAGLWGCGMDGWLKALVAAACVVVIAGGGYFAWKENGAANAREVAQDMAICREYAGILADLKDGKKVDTPPGLVDKATSCFSKYGIKPANFD